MSYKCEHNKDSDVCSLCYEEIKDMNPQDQQPKDIPTPRCDAEGHWHTSEYGFHSLEKTTPDKASWIPIKLGRTLERELVQKEQELAKANNEFGSESPNCGWQLWQKIAELKSLLNSERDNNESLQSERDKLQQECLLNEAAIRKLCGKSAMSYPAINAVAELKEERDKLRKALEALLRQTSNIEVLGEWEALEINTGMRKTVREKVNAVINQCDEALNHSKSTHNE